MAVCEEVDLALTGKCRFAEGEYWRPFVEVDLKRFLEYLDEGGSPANTIKLSDEQSKLFIEAEKGDCAVYLWAPEAIADKYEEIWNRIK